jgi:hypothetical protein
MVQLSCVGAVGGVGDTEKAGAMPAKPKLLILHGLPKIAQAILQPFAF